VSGRKPTAIFTAKITSTSRQLARSPLKSGRWIEAKELRTSFVSMMSYQGVPVEEIARLAGHASSRTTEVIYRRELRPVITTGAEVMDQIFRPRRGYPAAADAAG